MTTEPTENLNTEQDRERAQRLAVELRSALDKLAKAEQSNSSLARSNLLLVSKLADAEDDLRIGDEHRDELVKRVLALSPGPADPTAPTEPPADRRHPQAMEPVSGKPVCASVAGAGRPANGSGVGTDGPGVAEGVDGALGRVCRDGWAAAHGHAAMSWDGLIRADKEAWTAAAQAVLTAGKPVSVRVHVSPCSPLTLSAYQALAQRTANQSMEFDRRLSVAVLGLVGEAAEVSEHVKKYLGHGHELDRAKLCEEAGDCIWYLAELASLLGVELGSVAEANIAKLRVRYKDGFSEEASRNRPSGNGG